MLDSGFFENETWGALHKAWKGYVIAKNKKEYDKMLHYADIIQELQDDLGLRPVSSFHDIGKSALRFYSSRAAEYVRDNRTNNNNYSYSYSGNNNNSINDEERFTDEYHENFTDDPEYEKERFTDDNAYRENFTDDYH